MRRVMRNKIPESPTHGRSVQTGIVQLFSAPQFILAESYSDEDQVEAGRKWQAAVLRKTQAVVASWWGGDRRSRGEPLESCGKRSILPPTYTLQHLVREHFETLRTTAKGTEMTPRERETQFTGDESTRPSTEGSADQGSLNSHTSASTTGASGVTSSQPTTPHGQKKDNLEQPRVFGSRLGYYVLRAEQILLEGFYVAPGGEVSSVRLRYPHVRDIGPLVPSSEYGVQLLRQLVTSLHARVQLQKNCPLKNAAEARARSTQLAGEDEQKRVNGAADHPVKRGGQAQAPTLHGEPSHTAPQGQRVTVEKCKLPENALGCIPAKYNPFLRCLNSQRLSGIVHGRPCSATRAAGTGESAEPGGSSGTPSTTEQDQSHLGAPGDHAGAVRADVQRLQEGSALKEAASRRAGGRNFDENAEAQSPLPHTLPQTSRGGNGLRDADDVAEKLLLNRKVLIIHLGPRSDGLPLAYPDGAGGRELQRQRLVRQSLIELLASSDQTDVCMDDCGSCLGSVADACVPEPRPQTPDERQDVANAPASRKGGNSTKGPQRSTRESGSRYADEQANMHKTSNDKQWPDRFGQLDAVGAVNLDAMTVAKTLQDVKLESDVRKQLLALEQELRLASPTRWAVDGAVVEKYLENHQVEISVAWGRPPPALHLPLTPFFTHNILLIRVEMEKCPKKYGENSYGVPPNSVLEHALYLLAHPVAGLAAIAAFHYGRNPEKSLLERMRTGREQLDRSASGIAMHAANFWGRATGASMQTSWIAHVRVRAPGSPSGSTIALLDGRLNAEAGSFVPSSSSQKSEGRFRFPAEVPAWGWRYAEPLKPDEGPFLHGRLAGYGETAGTCKTVDALVRSTAANLQTRIIPQMFVSGLRGRSVILALSSTDVPFKGEQLVSQGDLGAQWHAETSPQRRQ